MADFAQALEWLKAGEMVTTESNSYSGWFVIYAFGDHFKNNHSYLGWKRASDFTSKRTQWKDVSLSGCAIFSSEWRKITMEEINRINGVGE